MGRKKTTTKTETPAEPEGPRPFNRFLARLGDGDCHQQMSDEVHKLGKLMHGLLEKGASKVKGSITLKIDLSADMSGIVDTDYTISVREPRAKGARTLLFMTDDGELSETNPKQMALPLQDVSRGQGTVQDVEPDKPLREVE